MPAADGPRFVIPPLDERARSAAHERWANLTKPEGSLGRLEELAERLAAIRGSPTPSFRQPGILVFAADHGVTEEGVSAYPKEVTSGMVENFRTGGAAISVLARLAHARLAIVDVGVDGPEPAEGNGLFVRRVARGTKNLLRGRAMTPEQAHRAVSIGAEIAERLVDDGVDLVAVGDMGIGNTTPSSAITAVLTGRPPEEVVGRGTGVGDAAYAQKVSVVCRALELHHLSADRPWDVLEAVGGFEIGAIAGACLAAASRRVPVILDGFISTTAALWASRLEPAVLPYLVPSHRSTEPGHRAALATLGLTPYLDLDLRLGEGTGAALQILLCEASTRLLGEMATFEEAAVARKNPLT